MVLIIKLFPMKKVIALVMFLMAFAVNVEAQEKKMSTDEAAKNDIIALTSKIKISESLQQDLLTLMTMKHEIIQDQTLSAEKKSSALKAYEHKLMSALTPKQREQLTSDKALLKKLTN